MSNPRNAEPMLTVRDVAELTTLSEWTIRTYVSQRKIPFMKLGRRVLFERDDIADWLESFRVPMSDNSKRKNRKNNR